MYLIKVYSGDNPSNFQKDFEVMVCGYREARSSALRLLTNCHKTVGIGYI